MIEGIDFHDGYLDGFATSDKIVKIFLHALQIHPSYGCTLSAVFKNYHLST